MQSVISDVNPVVAPWLVITVWQYWKKLNKRKTRLKYFITFIELRKWKCWFVLPLLLNTEVQSDNIPVCRHSAWDVQVLESARKKLPAKTVLNILQSMQACIYLFSWSMYILYLEKKNWDTWVKSVSVRKESSSPKTWNWK